LGKVPCEADISTFIAHSVATEVSNLCTRYSSGKSQNGRHMKISKGPYNRLGSLRTKMPRGQTLPSKIQVGKYVTKHDRGNGPPSSTELPMLNVNFYLLKVVE